MRVAWPAVVLLSATLLAQPSPPDALLDAARAGNVGRVTALLDAGVSINATNRYGVSALGFAAERGHFDIVRLLVERGADVNVVDSFYGSRPVDFALRGGRLDIAVYLLEHKAQGAVSVLNTAIRRRDAKAVGIALATKQADAAALASATTVAAQVGDATIVEMVKTAAAATPAAAPRAIALGRDLLAAYAGNYQSASTGAVVKLSLDGDRFTLTSDGQPPLTLQAIEDRRVIADESPELNVVLSGRGGIIERLSIVRGSSSVRYEREGFGDATSAAPDPSAGAGRVAAAKAADPEVPRGEPINWPAFRGANAAGVGDGQGAVADWDVATGRNIKWKTAIPGLGTSSPIVWGNRVYAVSAASDEGKTFRVGLTGDISLPQGRSSSDAVAWSHDRDGTYISSPIVYRDQVYTLNNNGILTAYDANSGARLYRARVGGGGAFSASPIAADGKLFMASEDGDVFVVQAGREYAELGKYSMGEVLMASPAISNGVIVIRTLGHIWGIGK